MPSLRQIDLRMNAFGGGVPGVIGNLQFLERLDLSGNNFSGIQAGFGDAPELNDVDMSDNNLGGFSPEFAGLVSLTELDLSFNQMNGAIPDGIVLLPLQALDISNNSLDDPAIPDFRQLGSHDFVEELLLNNNQCLGTPVLAIYNFVIAEDPAWENCGNPPPPAGP
jgi:Leucine-rich repeat (LRR) protein